LRFYPAVTLHDYLYFLRTVAVLCRRELYFKNLSVLYFFNLLPRCRSGCKDATNFDTCQVLFSLYFSVAEALKIPHFLQSGLKCTEFLATRKNIFLKKSNAAYKRL